MQTLCKSCHHCQQAGKIFPSQIKVGKPYITFFPERTLAFAQEHFYFVLCKVCYDAFTTQETIRTEKNGSRIFCGLYFL